MKELSIGKHFKKYLQTGLLASAFFFTGNLQAGDWSSGGGDPVLVKALPFPNQAILQEALDLLKVKINQCPYHENFKRAFTEELLLLEKNRHFYYVPDLFSVGLNRFPGDYDTLVSNGAMTEYTRGAAIYFSRQSITYDARTLARVIAQEIPHHIFTSSYGKNEIFVNGLGTYLIVGGEPPVEPIHYGQVIYEEFVNKPGPALEQLAIQAQARQLHNFRWHEAISFLAQGIDRERGSYGLNRLGVALLSATAISTHNKKSKLSLDMELTRHALKTCVFTSYEDGASGLTLNEQAVLVEMFLSYLQQNADLIKELTYLEDIQLPSEEKLTNCAFGIVSTKSDSVLVLQRVRMHDDEVRDIQGRPFNPAD